MLPMRYGTYIAVRDAVFAGCRKLCQPGCKAGLAAAYNARAVECGLVGRSILEETGGRAKNHRRPGGRSLAAHNPKSER